MQIKEAGCHTADAINAFADGGNRGVILGKDPQAGQAFQLRRQREFGPFIGFLHLVIPEGTILHRARYAAPDPPDLIRDDCRLLKQGFGQCMQGKSRGTWLTFLKYALLMAHQIAGKIDQHPRYPLISKAEADRVTAGRVHRKLHRRLAT